MSHFTASSFKAKCLYIKSAEECIVLQGCGKKRIIEDNSNFFKEVPKNTFIQNQHVVAKDYCWLNPRLPELKFHTNSSMATSDTSVYIDAFEDILSRMKYVLYLHN